MTFFEITTSIFGFLVKFYIGDYQLGKLYQKVERDDNTTLTKGDRSWDARKILTSLSCFPRRVFTLVNRLRANFLGHMPFKIESPIM